MRELEIGGPVNCETKAGIQTIVVILAILVVYGFGAGLYGASLDGAKGINPNLCTPLRILLEQPGKIRAYKLVKSSGEGPCGEVCSDCEEILRENSCLTSGPSRAYWLA